MSESQFDFPPDSLYAERYKKLCLQKPTESNLDAQRMQQQAAYIEMYNDLLRRILPIATEKISEEDLGKILRRAVVPIFKTAQEAARDQLTGLPKRNVLNEVTNRYMDLVRQIGGVVTFVYMDLDNFKDVNDRYGHDQGDKVLGAFGRILQQVKRSYDVAGTMQEEDRLAAKTAEGDEFGIVFFGSQAVPSELLNQRIVDELKSQKGIQGMEEIGVSMGIARFDSSHNQEMTATELIKQADIAMYNAKLITEQKVKFVEYRSDMEVPSVSK